ncbi:MAG TPA: ankyrin repeat domain-containing protein, partial [Candidatus Babeliaceae bacterium]|nr:ankyrin repeat domain-containing protein [Candidatus Babeliaceae bacterium]
MYKFTISLFVILLHLFITVFSLTPEEQKNLDHLLLKTVKSYISFASDVKLLLLKGANPNSYDKTGRSALHHAVNKSPDIVELLLHHGANPNAQDKKGVTPLSYAAEWEGSD